MEDATTSGPASAPYVDDPNFAARIREGDAQALRFLFSHVSSLGVGLRTYLHFHKGAFTNVLSLKIIVTLGMKVKDEK